MDAAAWHRSRRLYYKGYTYYGTPKGVYRLEVDGYTTMAILTMAHLRGCIALKSTVPPVPSTLVPSPRLPVPRAPVLVRVRVLVRVLVRARARARARVRVRARARAMARARVQFRG